MLTSITTLSQILGNKNSAKIIKLLNNQEMTLTQIFNSLPEIKYRESIHKILHKLLKAGLIKRIFNQKNRAYLYKTSFNKIEINNTLELEIK